MATGWFDRLARWNERRTLARRPIPDELWHLTLARYPFLTQRPAADIDRLRDLSTLFLADKEFTGAHGLAVTDEMAVAIAAQACLPVLRLGLTWYDAFKGIVIHADAVVAPREVMDETGVVHAYDEELSGEAMEGGPLMLSWQDVAEAGDSAEWGYNVVIHEFAHVIDQRAMALPDGVPGPLRPRAKRGNWVARGAGGRVPGNSATRRIPVSTRCSTLTAPRRSTSSSRSPSEAFFVAGRHFADRASATLYGLLAGFYRQDPAGRSLDRPMKKGPEGPWSI